MQEQNAKVMAMSDLELKAIINKGEVNTFLHFQAKREYNARHNGGKRKIEVTEKDAERAWFDNAGQYVDIK